MTGTNKREESSITNEEIKLMMEQGADAGVFHESEQVLVSNVLRLDEQPVVAIMTHRQDIHVLDLNRRKRKSVHTLLLIHSPGLLSVVVGWKMLRDCCEARIF